MDKIKELRNIEQEGWTDKELIQKQTQAAKASIIVFILGIALIILSFVLLMKYSLTLTLLISGFGVACIIVGALSFYWFKETGVEEADHQTTMTVNEVLSLSVYLLSLSTVVLSLVVSIVVAYWNRIGQDFYVAQGGSVKDYINGYEYSLYWILPTILIATINACYIAFVSYITIRVKTLLRSCVYAFIIATMIMSALLIHYNLHTPFTLMKGVTYFVCISLLGVGLFGFAVVYALRLKLVRPLGYFTLICVFLLVSASFTFFRTSENYRTNSITDCNQQMRSTHQDWIASETQCKKYTDTCDLSAQAYKWETDKSLTCLNLNCCNALADSLNKYYFFASFALLFLIIFSFGLSVVFFQLDSKILFQAETKRAIDYLFVLILVISIVFCIMVLVTPKPLISRQTEIIVSNQVKVAKNNDPIVYPSGIENITGCVPLKKVQDVSVSQKSRVTILAPNNQIVITQYINDKNLAYLPQQLSQQILYPTSKPTDGFFGIQGEESQVNDFLDQNVQICGTAEKKVTVNITPISDTRLLFHKHHKEGFTQSQTDFLNNLKFREVKVSFKNIATKADLQGVTLYFYRAEEDCGKIDIIPNRIAKLNSGDTIKLTLKDYYLGAEIKGFYLFCSKITVKEDTNFSLELIPKNTEKGQFTVVMEAPPSDYNLSLGAAYAECQVGYFNTECGGMVFYGSKYAQAISVNILAKRQYTFFVYFEPKDPSLQALNKLKSEGQTVDTSKFNNDGIFKINPIVTLYGQEQRRPIIRYYLPKQAVTNEPNLTWLVLCIDGTVGDISQSSPNAFWKYSQNPTKYERANESRDMFPVVCAA